MKIITLLFPILLIMCSGLHGEETFHENYQFGKDQIIINTNENKAEPISFYTTKKKDVRLIKKNSSLNLRSGVTYYKEAHSGKKIAEEEGLYYYVNYSNIGKYIEEIQSANQVSNLLSFLHINLYNQREY